MRIISGQAKGHKLKSPKGLDTRPTTDRIKESLFNIISSHIHKAYVLDLFAGTGNLGLEALSRGADHAVFVDKNKIATNIIIDNLEHTKLIDRSNVLTCDYKQYIDKFDDKLRKFDIIFLDPPYHKNFIEPVLKKISEKQLLNKEGIIVVETDKDDELSEIIDDFKISRSRNYGRTVISIYKYS